MPKIINNLGEVIFENARKLFFENGYKGVDMKEIGNKCNIAVGTLYNYYPNKHAIYIEVLKKSWEETFEKLNGLKNAKLSSKDFVKNFIDILYEDVRNRKGIGIQIMKLDCKEDENLREIKNNIILKLRAFLEPIKKVDHFNYDKNINEKILYTFLINLFVLIQEYPDEKDNNLKYIYHMVEAFIPF